MRQISRLLDRFPFFPGSSDLFLCVHFTLESQKFFSEMLHSWFRALLTVYTVYSLFHVKYPWHGLQGLSPSFVFYQYGASRHYANTDCILSSNQPMADFCCRSWSYSFLELPLHSKAIFSSLLQCRYVCYFPFSLKIHK